ncbi:Predicted transcriptional regulator, contains HTH domain [Halogeometricum rufum]|uniref:Predicted transcriptional regulator, contains HTH domain n=1 Tax=Halogeometricum rufum TaxID=553469 RepID=A0A1I6J0N5_9EURY|nr:Predicted transcriptional regulator, contains HTH domain [Halogeometricum rufum]
MSARGEIAFLVGSESRVAVLRALRDQPYRPSELAAECSCARETAQRTVTAFADRGWVEKLTDDGRYALTAAGDVVAESYDEFEATVAVADRLSVLLSNLGDVAVDLDPVVLDRLHAAEATADNPHAPINRFLTVAGEEHVERFRGITPIVSRIFNEAAARVIGPESSVELVVDEAVLETSASEYPDDLERAFELDQFRLFVAPAKLDFGLMIIDGHAYLAAYDSQGTILASVDGTDDEFVAWAERTFRRYRESARPFTATQEGGDVPTGVTDDGATE